MDFDLKTAVDIGLGGISIFLWFKQLAVNRMQVEIDKKQNTSNDALTLLVMDHDKRITTLERHTLPGRGKKAR